MPAEQALSCRELTVADREGWDAFVAAHPLGNFCQAWAWGEVKGRGEWTPHRLGLFADDSLVAGAQVLLRPLALGRSLAYAPRGPVVDLTTTDGAQLRAALFDGVQQFCLKHRAICLKIDPCLTGTDRWLQLCGARPVAGGDGFGGTQPKWVMRLALTPGMDEVFSRFKSDYRNRIRKAGRRGVTVRLGETDADWLAFDELLRQTADRQEFRVRAKSYFAAIRDELDGPCQAALFLAEREGRAVGAILCVAYGPTCWYLYGGMNEEGREHYSGYLLQWEAIQWSANRGCTVYDFRGVAPPDAVDHPTYGLNRFKEGFGPEVVEWVGEYDLIFSPLSHRLFTAALPRVKRLLKRRS